MTALSELFELTGREYDLAEAYWEIEHVTAEQDAVELHPQAHSAFMFSIAGLEVWCGSRIMAWTPHGAKPLRIRK